MFYLQYWFYKKYLKRLFFIVCIMFMFICTALAVIQLLHVSLGAIRAFRTWLLLFVLSHKCLLVMLCFQTNKLDDDDRVSAYELSNDNKWRWCLRMIAADRRTHSPNRLVWSEGWRPPGAQSAFIKWPGKLSQWLCHDESTINIVSNIIIILLYY